MNERIEMLKEMVEKYANPVGWIGYHEGHLVSFLQTQEQVDSFLKNTDTAGRVEPVYTHPVKELTDAEINVVAILQDAEIVPVGHEIWKTGEEFNKYKKIVLATAKALRKAQE